MKKLAVIGHFAHGLECLDGQTVKTKIVTDELSRQLGEENVISYDTHGGARTLLKAPLYVLRALKNAENVMMLPAHNGLRVFGRLLPLFKRFFKGRRIHYSVVGGWLPTFLKNKKGLWRALKRFDCIYVETTSMQRALNEMGFENIIVVPNCKELPILAKEEAIPSTEEPYRLCTFSRVNEKKGIADAVMAVQQVNERLGRTVYALDIYGQVEAGQEEWFEHLRESFTDEIRYCGLVPFDKSVEVLKDYYALLFPTKYFTEGVPGTVIDAYAAGVPVISVRWESFADVIEDGVTGIGIAFGDPEATERCLLELAEDPQRLNALKPNCLQRAHSYLPAYALSPIVERL